MPEGARAGPCLVSGRQEDRLLAMTELTIVVGLHSCSDRCGCCCSLSQARIRALAAGGGGWRKDPLTPISHFPMLLLTPKWP